MWMRAIMIIMCFYDGKSIRDDLSVSSMSLSTDL
uniref:Uncharacterized protein n=1 Tax=Anguilla anguilla TaxID=7936 RepID=A0A0E9T177_ANGAN